MKISVICASRNEEKDINLLIESYMMTENHNTELLIIDDNIDSTKDIVKSYKKSKKKKGIRENGTIKLLNGEDNGCCIARNQGVQKAVGDYICYMTADSYFTKDYFIKVRKTIENNDYPDAIMTRSYIDLNKYNSIYAKYIHYSSEHKFQNPLFMPNTSQGYLVKKDTALGVNLIDAKKCPVNVCRDYTLVQKIKRKGLNIIRDDNLIIFHKPPNDLFEFYDNQKTRGVISAGNKVFFQNKRHIYIFINLILKSIYMLTRVFTIDLIRILSFKNVNFNTRFKLIGVNIIRIISFIHGELKTALRYTL